MSVLICPDDPFRHTLERASQAVSHPDWVNASSYGMNEFILGSPDSFLANIERHQPSRPWNTLLLADLGPDSESVVAAKGEAAFWIPQRSEGRLPWADRYEYAAVESPEPWLTQRHGRSINVLTLGGAVRAVRTSHLMRQPITSYYAACAAGDCTFCNELVEDHYSFYHASTYWWTGSVPEP
jgi:hypothetical protein